MLTWPCSSSGKWELTGHSWQACGSALGRRLPPSRRPPVQDPAPVSVANSKQMQCTCPDKESTDKDNFGEGVCLPPRAPPLPSPILLQPLTSSPLHWLFPHLDALQRTAGPKFRPQLLWKPPPTPSSPPLRLTAGFCTNLHGPRGYFRPKRASNHKSTQYDPGDQ